MYTQTVYMWSLGASGRDRKRHPSKRPEAPGQKTCLEPAATRRTGTTEVTMRSCSRYVGPQGRLLDVARLLDLAAVGPGLQVRGWARVCSE